MNAMLLSENNCNQSHSGSGAPRLLIVSDSADRLRAMRSALSAEAFQVSEASTVAEVRSACRGGLELAVVDAGAADVIAVLRALRTSAGCEQIPILVDINDLPDELRMPGVLPRYRAMPCGQTDLLKLVACYLRPERGSGKGEAML